MAKVLLTDDEPTIVFLTKKILEKEGHEVVVAENGEECMGMLKNDRPDLILLDVMMPGESGWEVCRKIKEDEKTRDIPVAMFTVRSSEDSVKKSLEYAHADTQIDKPFKIEELFQVVNNFFKKNEKVILNQF
ncbi:MAG: PleD family two-component system response regulator [Candidatus Hydrothermarchaeales archaeon]